LGYRYSDLAADFFLLFCGVIFSTQVILDVIFTHTCENNDAAPDTISFRGIDNATYYILEKNGRLALLSLFVCGKYGMEFFN
jgi:hypothetical protein